VSLGQVTGLGDTNILIQLEHLAPADLPAELGRKPRRRVAELMIASVAAASKLPLFTTNPADFRGLDQILTVVPVAVPVR